jgi:hypothetical protein
MEQPGILFLAALVSAAFLSLNAWGQQTTIRHRRARRCHLDHD